MKRIERKKLIQLICAVFLLVNKIHGQKQKEIDREELRRLIEERIEFMSSDQIEAEADYLNLFQSLEYYYYHPINLNRTNAEELRQLELINEIQIQRLLKHIEENGDLLALEELQSIKGFDLQSIHMLRPFCSVSDAEKYSKPNLHTVLHEGESNLLLRSTRLIEQKKGPFLGNPWGLYSRYRFQYYKRLSLGITAEKDPGEEFFKGSQKKGFDFYSAHLFIQDFKGIKQLAVGDYQAQFGQGLTFWPGLAFSGGLGVSSLKRAARNLVPYTSAQEDQFLRGIGITMEKGKIETTVFLSRKKIGGTLVIDEISGIQKISSLYTNGLHRTINELEKKERTREELLGFHSSYRSRRFELGFTAVGRRLEFEQSIKEQPYQKYYPRDKEQLNMGIDYSYYLNNCLFYGEISRSDNNGFSMLNGLIWVPSKYIGVGMLQRNYGRYYTPISSNALGSNSRNSNERGTYLNLELNLSRTISFQSNSNIYAYPWLRYQIDAPSSGKDHSLQLNYCPSRSITAYVRFRIKERSRNSTEQEQGVSGLHSQKNKNLRLHLSYQITEHLRIQNRLEISEYELEEKKENGYLLYQDLQYSFQKWPITLTARYALFETESYQSRIYAYENDILYAFSIPPYYGVGSRYYLLLKWKIKKGIDLWFRFDQTAYLDRDSIGSGRDEILSTKRSQIKSQLRLKF